VSVTAASGFVAAGVHAGIRRTRKDLALVRSTRPAVGAAMFTANRFKAAPLLVSSRHLSLTEPQAVVVNSGSANAATGEPGRRDALTTAAVAARLLGLESEEVLVFSTGVIGSRLPMERLLAGLQVAAASLSPGGGLDAAEAILTTDTRPKEARSSVDGFTVGGMAKGSGMIHPQLATMLAFLTTDYPLARGEPIAFLRPAVEHSFNSISVDGECSTNDAVVLLANGASGIERSRASDERFARVLGVVCDELAEQIVSDGEGATVVARIEVSGAPDEGQARAIAARIATSPLVKTALFGRDANWGRVIAAAGSARWNHGFAALDPERLTLTFNGTVVLARGAPQNEEPTLAEGPCSIELDLGLGEASASYLTTDLSYDYVRINSEYRT
jgi:glutamate N-acetyltransferase / amino-acid N-acetyltransferase